MFKSAIAAIALCAGAAAAGDATGAPPTAFDVAEDHTRLVVAAEPVRESGMPAHGAAFVSQGYIYPAGTLKDGAAGVLKNGAPAFPDLVLGTWTCDGYFVGEAGDAETGVWVISRQVFAFEDGDTIITQGTEIADIGEPNLRPITGATGAYAKHEGGLIQTTLGFNEYMAISATFALEKAASKRASGDAYDPLDWDSGGPVGPVEAAAPKFW